MPPRGTGLFHTSEEPRSGIAVARTTFSMLDTDRDGKLSAKELTAAPAQLLKADRNDDDLVTLEEMEACALQEGAGREDAGRVLLLDPLDKDQDGKLNDAELGGFARRTPDLELTFRFHKNGTEAQVQVNSQPSSLPGMTHNTKDLVSIPLGRLAVQLSPGASMIRPLGFGRDARRDWWQLDRDKKGFVADNGKFGGHFKMMDRNNDGKLTEAEYVGYWRRLSELQVRATASCVSLVFLDSGLGIFDVLDTDGDGILTVQEMAQAPKLLERFGKSANGYLTERDLPRTWNLLVRRGPAGGRGFHEFGNGGFVVSNPVGGPYERKWQDGPEWFCQMDSNGDGYLSRREFLGTDEQFRQIDSNGDGRISALEATQADAAMRKKK
jgi:Ca2+-binding EF-hand superfamily protein